MERLLKYRKQIDEIDEQLLDLFADRFAIVSEIRELKKQTNAPVLDEKRWNEILEKMLER
ncbi:MAG: chorismate mutase [Candidatus Peribacteria bacterium]|jgi:chorismate mutase|nr:chorismate mutase [Candidatus Peribacteria bacterium]